MGYYRPVCFYLRTVCPKEFSPFTQYTPSGRARTANKAVAKTLYYTQISFCKPAENVLDVSHFNFRGRKTVFAMTNYKGYIVCEETPIEQTQ